MKRLGIGIAIVGTTAAVLVAVAIAGGVPRDRTVGQTVVLEDLRFVPNRLDARAGVPMAVVLINRGTERHDLDFPSLHMPGFDGVESILDPGESRSLTLSFDQPGTHTFVCSLPGHAAAGMTGAVFVSP